MRTQVIHDPAATVPRLLRIAEDGSTEETRIESLPFTIGRNPDCDFQIESPKVSREHAVISSQRGGFQIKDLGSTNGTTVNGQRIGQTDLNDGDIVVIADLEFTFSSAAAAIQRNTVTMAIDAAISQDGSADSRRLVREIRRVHEMLTHRGVRCHVSPILELGESRLFGFQANHPFQDELTQADADARVLLTTDSRIAEQVCYLNRLVVAEESLGRQEPTNLFLRLHQSEMGGDRLTESLENLAEILSGRHQLVVTVPAGTVGMTAYFTEIRKRLSEIGAQVAYDHFEAGPAQLDQWSANPPDFVKLAPSMTLGIGRQRQRRPGLASLIAAASDLEIRIVATGLHEQSDVDACHELGCPLGEGPVFGSLPMNTAFRDEPLKRPLPELAAIG
ncbi:MAG: FHA domain-containing protein [Thermoguttaceae bacterium]